MKSIDKSWEIGFKGEERMEKIRLGDICIKQSSKFAQKDLEKLEGGYPVYGASGLIKKINVYHQDKEYVAIVKDGAGIGRTMFLPAKSSVIGTLQYLIPKEDINAKYLYYAVKSRHLEKYFTGTTIPHIYFKDYQNERIVWHRKTEQKYIVSVLENIEKIIDIREQELQKMDELIKARFIEMFIATDVASEWPYCTIADVSSDMRTGPFGSALHHDEFVDSGVFVLGIDNAVENKFSYNRMRYITEEKYQQLKRYTVYPGDVIITIMGTVGRSAVIPADMPKAINTKHLACITPNVEMVNAQFLSCAFQIHPGIRMQLQNQSKGAIMDGLNLTIIKGLSFRIPPINLQNQFVEFYKQTDKSKVVIQKALDEAKLLFDSLMQKYFGQ